MTSITNDNLPPPVDFSSYPPSLVVWTFTAVDTVCEPLGCSEWRSVLPSRLTTEQAWLSPAFQVPQSIFSILPSFMTYQEFLEQQQIPSSYGSLRQYAFHTPSTSLANLTTVPSMVTLVVLVWLLRQCKAVWMPLFSQLGRTAGRHTHGPEWEANNEVRIQKFGEYVFRLVFHSVISIAGMYLFWDAEWWEWLSLSNHADATHIGTKSLFWGFPHQPVSPGMTWYYLIQAAYNMEAMVCLLELSFDVHLQSVRNHKTKSWQFPVRVDWSETVRGDFREMFIHHVVTNLLVLGSSLFRFTRVGSMVFLVHDISDVPVDLSKLANFLKWKTTTAVCFATMVLVWMLTRLTILPFVIYRSVLFESWLVCASGYIPPVYHVMYKPVFVVLIGLLILLHFIWFSMFIRMGYVLVAKGEAHDLSEHKKGEVQQHASNGTKANGHSNKKHD
jgi:hypothetical protein